MSERISYQPTDGLSYDPTDAIYWNRDSLDKELTRAFEICHGCRMCFKYCDSFPTLFSLIDDKYDGDVTKLREDEIGVVMDHCFQCKLCEVQCPYTPRDKHEFQLDFPALVHRYKAIRNKEKGGKLREKVLGNPDQAGTMARLSLGMANVLNKVGLHRWFLEQTLGIHRDKLLPDFASETFEAWARKRDLMAEEPKCEVVLFQTCFVQHNKPQVGKDTIAVFEKNGIDIKCVAGLVCCGMPAWESGDLDGLRDQAHVNLDLLMPFVENGAVVVAINPTCSMMMRREWPHLLEGEDRERAKKLAEAIRDPGEYLWSIRKEERFNTDFKSTPEKVAYHTPCHLRAQAVGFKGRDLMKKIPGVKPSLVMECCGHNGTFAMTTEGFEASIRIGKKAFDGMKDANSDVWASDCPLAALQFEQHAGKQPMHPMSVLALAYKEDGFPKKIEEE